MRAVSRIAVALAPWSFAPPARPIAVADAEPAAALAFLALPAGWNDVVHPSPRRQMPACLAGSVRVTAGDGENRVIGPGDLWRLEDTGGKGHPTRVIGDGAFRAAVVRLT